jgi:uncharacterized protein HemY
MPWARAKVIEMASMTMNQACAPLDEGYFTQAARNLDVHHADGAHQCLSCGGAWPCAKALAAAFVLELRTV